MLYCKSFLNPSKIFISFKVAIIFGVVTLDVSCDRIGLTKALGTVNFRTWMVRTERRSKLSPIQ